MSLLAPADISRKLVKLWQKPDRRLSLFNDAAWPIEISIPAPSPRDVINDTPAVRAHLDRWRLSQFGEVVWHKRNYRGLADPLSIPAALRLQDLEQWVVAAGDAGVLEDWQKLTRTIERLPPDSSFVDVLVHRLPLIRAMDQQTVETVCDMAAFLAPGCAAGLPLRALSFAGTDSKFLERHRAILVALVASRFGGVVREEGLESFLGCTPGTAHWLLVIDLDGSLLPVEQMRVRDSELAGTALPCDRVVIVENEQCAHHLPRVEQTLAILGAGLNLSWLDAAWLQQKQIAYWGDLDTWGLTMLASARLKHPDLSALLMDAETYDEFAQQSAVPEPQPASETVPAGLNADEVKLYSRLHASAAGRLEQERIPVVLVNGAIRNWAAM